MRTHIIENSIVVNTIMASVAEAKLAFPDAICIDGATGEIGWTWNGTEFVKHPAPPVDFPKEQAAFILKIDADADQIYTSAIGARSTEYIQSETDALAYKTAGYTGTVPPDVHCWAVAKSQTDKWAADDILLAAAKWRGAQTAIRSNRLMCKEQARAAVDVDALQVVKAQWDTFVVYITAQLGAA